MLQTDESLRPFRFAMFVLFAGLVTATIVFLTRFSLALWMEVAGDADTIEVDTNHLEFRIGDTLFTIPANLVEQALPLSEDVQKGRIDLALHWPTMSGKTEENKAVFADLTRNAPIIRVMLREHVDPITASQRFERILQPAFIGVPVDAPSGLTGYQLAEGSGYGGETLYFDQSSGNTRFTLRCTSKDLPTAPAECLRQIQISTHISLEYRYRIGLLRDWREIDTAISQLSSRLSSTN